ncbi:MAG: nucleotidyltransferase domain-containing protein, partial [Chloroflexota bacterium]
MLKTVSPKRRRKFSIARIVPTGCEQPVSETLPGAVRRIARRLRPEKIILFGSYAYGKPTPDSDVDLLVVMKTQAASVDRFLAVSQLLIPRPFPVDILVRTPQEIARALKKGDFFVEEIVLQGKVLYERRR